jgi:hypothetical protein
MADEALLEAERELSRLLALPAGSPPDAVLRLFADEPLRRELWSRPRSTAELRALVAAAPQAAPSSRAVVAESVAAFWRWARAGFGVVDAERRAARLQACVGCELYVLAPRRPLYGAAAAVTGETRICSLCGCFVAKKARLASEGCPAPDPAHPGLSLWGEPLPPP